MQECEPGERIKGSKTNELSRRIRGMTKGTCNEQGPFGAKALPDLVVVGVDLRASVKHDHRGRTY